MVLYIDKYFKCHMTNDGTMTEVQSDFFDNKCTEFIEGYRFIPEGEKWTRVDGVVFEGEMIAPWKPFHELEKIQREYEKKLYEQQKLLINELEQQAMAAKILMGVE